MSGLCLIDEIKEVDIGAILENPYQPRRTFSSEELEELAASIQEIGLIHPPVVRELSSDSYELIAGERRLRALKLLGKERIPVIVRHVSDSLSAESALIENIQRVDLNPLEVARSLKGLMTRFSLTQEDLADRVGKKRSTIANYLRLLQLPAEIQEWLQVGKITMGHAKAALSLTPAEQKKLCQTVIDQNLSVRQTEQKVQQMMKPVKKALPKTGDIFLKEIEKQLEVALGTKIQVTKNKIVIDYYSLDDLDRIFQVVNG